MREYLLRFFEEFDYPEEAREVLILAYDKIIEGENTEARFSKLLASYDESYDIGYGNAIDEMKEISKDAVIHEYTGALLLFICFSKKLEEYYKKSDIDREIFVTSMYDLKYKLMECKEVYGIYGSFVAGWFPGFFRLNRFGFGKLQFEIIKFGDEYTNRVIRLFPESPVINVHIPRTGGRLDEESRKRSYAMAAEFFAEILDENPIVFVCNSWLLFPRHTEILKPGSNVLGFMSDYDIYKSGLYDDYGQVWRLFDTYYTGDVDKLPQNGSFRRAYADLIRRGEKTGWGRGVYVYPRY